jgi:hypothetical protein
MYMPHDQEDQHQVVQRQRRIELGATEAVGRRDAHDAHGAVRQTFPLLDQQVHDVAHAQREDREVVPLERSDITPTRVADHAADGASGRKGGPEAPAVVHREDAHGIGAHGHEAAVRQVELPGVAGDQVQPRCRNGKDVGRASSP